LFFRTLAASVFTLCVLAMGSAAAQLRVYPPDPQPGEDVVLILAPPASALLPGQVMKSIRLQSAESGEILIRFDTTYAQSPPYPLGSGAMPVVLPAPQAGDYRLIFQHEQGLDRVQVDSIEIQRPAASAPATPARRGVTGNWFDPAQPGWGVNVLESDSGPQLFAVWLDYMNWDYFGPISNPGPEYWTRGTSWRVMSGGRWITPTTFRGVLYQSWDGTNPGGASKRATLLPVGYATLTFLDSGEMSFKAAMRSGFSFREVTREARLRKQAF
jgi:hypothetical protein